MFNFLTQGYKRVPLWGLVIVLSIFLLGGCGGGGDGTNPVVPGTSGLVTISGQVTDKAASATKVAGTDRQSPMTVRLMRSVAGVEGVTVKASSEGWNLNAVSTDKAGFFALEVPVPDSGRIVFTFSAPGRVTYQKALQVKAGESYSIQAVAPKYESKPVGADGTVSSDSFRIEGLPSGTTMTLYTGDPTEDEGESVFPGDYMAATANSDDVPIVSMAFFEASLTDASGNKKEFTSADVYMLLPEAYQDGTLTNPRTGSRYVSGDVIEWWSYDMDDAMWVQEDADPATDAMDLAEILSGDAARDQNPLKLYVKARVTHFSWWNADYPATMAYICVRVVDGDGEPLENVPVYSRGVTYMNTSRGVRTDSDGWAKGIAVKKSPSSTSREKAEIYAKTGNVEFLYDVTATGEGIVGSDDVYTPYDESQCTGYSPSITLSNEIKVSFEGVIQGTVADDSGTPLSSIKVYSSTGGVATTDSNGEYSLNVPLNAQITVYIAGVEGKEATVTSEDEPVTVNFTVPNQAPVITQLSKDPEGRVTAGSSVELTAKAKDPEGGTVSYAWSADEGTLSSATGATTTWTAPSTDSGTAQVTLTASDASGNENRMTIPISWGDLPTPGRLVVIVKDEDEKPVSNAWIVLHKEDGTVEESMQTNSLGKASFGDIGRTTATVTCAYKEDDNSVEISTIAGAPVAEIIFHPLEEDNEQGDLKARAKVGVNSLETNEEAIISPVSAYVYSTGLSTDVGVYTKHIQSDGKLSLLAKSSVWGDATSMKWGALYDQTLVSGDTFIVSLSESPTNLSWTSDMDLSYFSVTGTRKGVDYPIADLGSQQEIFAARGYVTTAKNAKTGTIQAANFSVDTYKYEATSFTPDTGEFYGNVRKEGRKLGSTRPTSFSIDMPDYLFSERSIDKGDRTALTWRLEGTDDMDMLVIELSNISMESANTKTKQATDVDWNIIMTPEKGDNSYTLPVLPNDIMSLLNGWEPASFTLEVTDLDNVTGYQSFINLYLSGEDPTDLTNYYRETEYPGYGSPE